MRKHIRELLQLKDISDLQYFDNFPIKILRYLFDILFAINSILNLHEDSLKFFAFILRYISRDPNESHVLSNPKIASAYFKNEKYEIAVRKIKYIKSIFIKEMELTGFYFFKINRQYVESRNNAPIYRSVYSMGEFDSVFCEIAKRISKIQSGNIKIEIYKIVYAILITERGYKPVPVGAHKSEPKQNEPDRDQLRREPNEATPEEQHAAGMELIYQASLGFMTKGKSVADITRKNNAAINEIEIRLRELRDGQTSNGNGHVKTFKQIKFNGRKPR